MNKKLLIGIIPLIALFSIGATTKDFRISDNSGNILKVNSDGSIPTTLSGTVPMSSGGTGLTTASDDTVLGSDGARWNAEQLPNCLDSGGNHLNYTASNNTWSCGTSGSSTPGGVNKNLQYNSGGVFTGNSNFNYNSVDNVLIVSSISTQVSPLINIRTNGAVSIFSVAVNPNMTGGDNTAAGLTAGDSLTSGSDNTFFGFNAGTATVTGTLNAMFGSYSGNANTASNNAFFGESSGLSNTSGSDNTFLGRSSGRNNANGSFNLFAGQAAGNANISGSAHVFVGYGAGLLSTGNNNTCIGYRACDAITSGSDNIFLGTDADGAVTLNGQIAIGRDATTTAANQLVIGSNTQSIIDGYIGNGVTNAAPAAFTLNASGGSGANIAGAALTLASGKSTGLGASGVVNIGIASSDTISSSTLGTLTNVATFRNSSGVASFDITGVFRSTRTTDLGWSIVNAANQACNITCTSACVFGMDTAALGNFLACDNAASDTCLCAGPT